jgi:ADP-heptose:LPS heptosyltransferase
MKALLIAAGGIGDMLRASPLIRVFAGLGYEVDLMLAWRYSQSVELFAAAPEVRRIFQLPLHSGADIRDCAGWNGEFYDLAAFTRLALWLRPELNHAVRARQVHRFPASWHYEGDSKCVERIARNVGWEGPLPLPLAMASDRTFELSPETVAIHPGCKPDWPHKRWHGFGELAGYLRSVALVGTESDLRTTGTYFEPVTWPASTKTFFGLRLRDTAALLRQCALVVSNDSGLFHLAAAVGTRALGIFGPTPPVRSAMPLPNVFTLTKELPCEPECRRLYPRGRRDCEQHLACLRELTVTEVVERIRAIAPEVLSQRDTPP